MERLFLAGSGVFGALGVLLGAFGAHGLEARFAALPDGDARRAWWETAARYHLIHAVALGLVAVVLARRPESTALVVAGATFSLGMILFSGSLYTMALTGARALGAVTPLGGVCFVVGWVALAVAGLR